MWEEVGGHYLPTYMNGGMNYDDGVLHASNQKIGKIRVYIGVFDICIVVVLKSSTN